MTSDQFVYWLKGMLKGMKFGHEKLPLAGLLEEELSKIDCKGPDGNAKTLDEIKHYR